MLARSFFIKSSSKLLVTRTGKKAWSSSILGRIRPLILELLALEWRKFHTFEFEYLWSQLVNLDQILCLAALGWGKACIRFWITQVSDRYPLGYLFFLSELFPFLELCPFEKKKNGILSATYLEKYILPRRLKLGQLIEDDEWITGLISVNFFGAMTLWKFGHFKLDSMISWKLFELGAWILVSW